MAPALRRTFLLCAQGSLAAVVLALVATPAQPANTASGVARSREIRVETSRLVALLGGESTNPEQVFSLPIERLLALGQNPDSGVHVKESDVRLQDGRLRLDGVGSDKANYVLIDPAHGTMQWVHPKHASHVEWRPPPAPAKSPTPLPQLEPLDKELTINGFRTRGYRLHTPAGTAWLWIADEPRALAPVFRALAELQTHINPEPESLDQLATIRGMREGVLVRLQVLTPKEYLVRDLVSFTPKTWNPAEFRVPPGSKPVPAERAGAATPAPSCETCE